ncbi:HAD family hydrolase [Aquiflexum gelatinilyticum]|uniref:HAD family hydrolase n=1 Tax=Aquiflexum gelatinilyticum TaxID=2961943 RepID=UPI0021678AF9|nr:HAD family phosphatase [Aquiflexum gelatinilyticum]MCS4433828.1 HAD family phosphatase [Aquiflexum gelatinilyticum]
MKLPKAIIFDMDGTLVDNIPYHRDAWLEFLQQHGIHLNSSQFHAQNHGTIDEMMQRFFPQIEDPHQLYELGQEKERTYREMYRPHIQEVNGLTAFLQAIKAKGLQSLLATMGDQPNIDFTLDSLEIRSYFSFTTGGHEVSKGKPDPEIFLLSMEKARLRPEECLVIEDSQGGILAAKRGGLQVVGISTSESKETLLSLGCDGVVGDFEELGRVMFG